MIPNDSYMLLLNRQRLPMICCFVEIVKWLQKGMLKTSYAFLRSVIKMEVIKVLDSLIRQSIRYLLCSCCVLSPHFANALIVCIHSIDKRTKIMPVKLLLLASIRPGLFYDILILI